MTYFQIALICTIFAVVAESATDVKDCPKELKRTVYLTAKDGVCYQFHMIDVRDYEEAAQECKKVKGGTLVMPKTKKVQDYLMEELNKYDLKGLVWIGLDDINEEGKFHWADGQELKKSDYNFWAKGNGPRSGLSAKLDDCVALDTEDRGEWHDYRCNTLPLSDRAFPYICQYPAKK